MEFKNSGERASGVRNYTRLCLALFVRRHSGLMEDESHKKGQGCCPSPGPRTAHCERFEALCAIHKANVTVALLFQTLIELKKGPPIACTRAALGTNRRSSGG